MWAKQIVLLPIAAILCTITIPEEIKMEGDLQDEVGKLIAKHVDSIRFKHNEDVVAYINTTYPAGTNLWSIIDGILARYRLIVDYGAISGTIEMQFKRGSAWMR